MNGRVLYFLLNFIAAFSGFILIIYLIEGRIRLDFSLAFLTLFVVLGIKEYFTTRGDKKKPEALIVDERRKDNFMTSVVYAFIGLSLAMIFMLVQPWFGISNKLVWLGIIVGANLVWLIKFTILERKAGADEE